MSLAQLVERYGLNPYEHAPSLPAPRLPRSGDLRGMGPLVWLEVERFDGKVEHWYFNPMPRLAYDAKNHQLWHIGGRYRLDQYGFHNVGPSGRAQPLTRAQIAKIKALPTQRAPLRDYAANHGGRQPHEAVRGTLRLPAKLVVVGRVRAIVYRNDKGDGRGRANYKHKFDRRDLPFIGVDPLGSRLFIFGGVYTVQNGWLYQ